MSGILSYLISFSIKAGIFAILTLGLNLQWGFTGLFNVGIAGFFAVGAYTTAFLTKGPSPEHLGGLGLPVIIGLLGSALFSGIIAFLIGLPVLKLREDYLAMATLGIAESIRLVFTNESWLSNGNRGIKDIPKPWTDLSASEYHNLLFLLVILVIIILIYLFIEKNIHSPWGRVIKAIREDELVTASAGKNVFRYKLESLVIGSMFMGLAGGLYSHYISFISPDVFQPMQWTFLVWVMLIIGGSGNNRGALLGALLVLAVWSGTEDLIMWFFSNPETAEKVSNIQGPLRIIIISIVLELVLLFRPEGIFGEKKKIF
ncbi:MAG: branched-chain amino acid ABC transporter permease [bacterium]